MLEANDPQRDRWALADDVVFLNHGSFGSCPHVVLEAQTALRARRERQPVRYFAHDLAGLLDDARADLARFLGADAARVAFVPNATTGVNAVLRSLPLAAGDELLTTDQAYNACLNALHFVADRAGASVRVVPLPFPIASADEAVDAVLAGATDKTKLVLLDHIASPTGLVLPVERLVGPLRERGVRVLVDGAHAPGQVALDLEALGADYYTGNLHKWAFAPKGAAFLHVAAEHLDEVRPTVISHGANASWPGRSRFLSEFDWTGTQDFTPWLCVPAALRFGAGLRDGGWDALRAANHALALRARDRLCESLGIEPPAPDDRVGAMAAVPLPDGEGDKPEGGFFPDPLQEALWERWKIEVPIVPWPRWPKRLVRVSAQAYNSLEDYDLLARALDELL